MGKVELEKMEFMVSHAKADINLCAVVYRMLCGVDSEEQAELLARFIKGYQETATDGSVDVPIVISDEQERYLTRKYQRMVDGHLEELINTRPILSKQEFYEKLTDYIMNNQSLRDNGAREFAIYDCCIDKRLPYAPIDLESGLRMENDEYNKYGSIVRTTNYTASDFSILFSCPNSDLVAISKNPGEYMINGEEISVDSGKSGYLNTKTGEIIGLYDNVANLTELNGETYANVYLEDKGWGLMDVASGETAIECQYSSTGLFRNGLISLQKESLFGCINETGEEVVPFSYIDPVEFGNRGNWTVGNKLSEIDIVLLGEYVLLTTEHGKCVESEIPGLKEGDEPKVNLFNAKDKNCTIQLLNDSNHDNVIESTRYINPWTGEIICEVGN